MSPGFRVLTSLCAALVPASLSLAQPWTAIPMHPTGFYRSQIRAVSALGQYGIGLHRTTETFLPLVWNGSSTSWSTLSPSLATPGEIYGAAGDQQVGAGGGDAGAALWRGTPESRVSLHNPTWRSSVSYATSGSEQVGAWQDNTTLRNHAVLWRGTAQSWVSLEPPGAEASYALAATDGYQGGYVHYVVGGIRAVMWRGSAESLIPLHPGLGYNESRLSGMAPGQQVGSARRPGENSHAALWRGTPESFVDLHPAGSGFSLLTATCGSAQVGWANLAASGGTAGIWFGTPESFVALGPTLPPGHNQSYATSVALVDGQYHVGGYAYNLTTQNFEAFLWVGVPAPGPAVCFLAAAGLAAAQRRRR